VSRRIEWLPRAIEDLLRVPSIEDAARLDRAIQDYARAGTGFVRRVGGPEGTELRLYVRGYYAAISLGPSDVVRVWRVIPFG